MAPMTRNRAGAGNVPGPMNATYYMQRASAGLIVTPICRNAFAAVSHLILPTVQLSMQAERGATPIIPR